MSSIHGWSFLLVATLALAAPLSAQWQPLADTDRVLAASSTPTITTVMTFGETSLSAKTALDSYEAKFSAPALPGQARESQNVALMIVGGAALVIGAVVGGDAGTLMMVGGGVAGLFGLYGYLR